MTAKNEKEWWKSFHVPEMAALFLERNDPAELAETVAFLMRELALQPGDRAYDQCCGTGSLGLALAGHGVRVVGTDLCEEYIRRAKQAAEERQAVCEFHLADAFEYVPGEPCQAVYNWYSSFGYSCSDSQNEQMLHRAYESLLPGGRFALDVPNFPGVLRGFQRQMVKRGKADGRNVLLVRESQVNLRDGVLEQVWTWHVEGCDVRERRSSLRMYLPHQIADMLEKCGFEDIRLLGSTRGDVLGMDSPRLICTARRPEK